MNEAITYVGLDVHAQSIQVTALKPDGSRPEWSTGGDDRAISGLIKKLRKTALGELRVCYEAGPTGFSLQRKFQDAGIECQVIAPSRIPVEPGQRIKTDVHDARKLADLFRANLLTEVHPPTPEEESVRGLIRCREDGRRDLHAARQRLGKFLLARGRRFPGNSTWTGQHRSWLREQTFDHEVDLIVFHTYMESVRQIEDRLQGLEAEIQRVADTEPYRDAVGALCCFRGIQTLTAMTILAELHSFSRFREPRKLMAFLGLVPSENSTGSRIRRGQTGGGNSLARWILIQSAHHAGRAPHVSKELRKRRENQPEWVVKHADRAMKRLYRRHVRLTHKNKPSNIVTVSVARELAGFVWYVLDRFEAQKLAKS